MEEGGVSLGRRKKTMGVKVRAKSTIHKYLVVGYACRLAQVLPSIHWRNSKNQRSVMIRFRIGE